MKPSKKQIILLQLIEAMVIVWQKGRISKECSANYLVKRKVIAEARVALCILPIRTMGT